MAYLDSTVNTGTLPTAVSVAVPVGVAANTIVIIAVTVEATDHTIAGNYPAGFTSLFEQTTTNDGEQTGVAWKRASGADSGSYTFGALGGGNSPWVCTATAFSGRHTTNPPVHSVANDNTGNPSTVNVNATGVTALQGDDLLWGGSMDINTSGAGTGFSPPAGYTEREDAENLFADQGIATQDNVSAGATGTVTGTFTMTGGTAGWCAFLIRIPAVPSQSRPMFRGQA